MPTISFNLTDEEVKFLQNDEDEVFRPEADQFETLYHLLELGLIEQEGSYWDKFYVITDFDRNVLDAINLKENQNLLHVT